MADAAQKLPDVVAKQVIASGRICTIQKEGWNRGDQKDILVLADLAKTTLAEKIKPIVLNTTPPELEILRGDVSFIRFGAQRAHQALIAKNVLSPYEAPLAQG